MSEIEKSQFGNYPLHQTEEQYAQNIVAWENEVRRLYLELDKLIGTDLRKKLQQAVEQQQDLTERLCIEGDDTKRERMIKMYESASERANFAVIGNMFFHFRLNRAREAER